VLVRGFDVIQVIDVNWLVHGYAYASVTPELDLLNIEDTN
jgi:hypothetical protein